ncbi:hypothetical protein CYD33_025520 [Escherichia coli]|nr:hypothetical protein [Escherichia coli O2]EFA4555093.1 hypothetical protein [Escherichia coli]EFH8259450.1 hypothetical protein [Escherichia coli]EFN7212918.1 hypothetical protein [Escherichia coli O2]MBK2863444.1 hypothetical protein [Escherichia coli]
MPRRTALFRNSCNVFRASACAFTTTIRALRGTFHQFREVCGFNALTCYANKKAPTFLPRLLPNLASMSTLNIIDDRGNQDFNFTAQFAFAPSIYKKYHFHFSEATHLQNYFSSGRY